MQSRIFSAYTFKILYELEFVTYHSNCLKLRDETYHTKRMMYYIIMEHFWGPVTAHEHYLQNYWLKLYRSLYSTSLIAWMHRPLGEWGLMT